MSDVNGIECQEKVQRGSLMSIVVHKKRRTYSL